MSSRCWQEWEGLDSDLTTRRQIIILAPNLQQQTRVFHTGNFLRRWFYLTPQPAKRWEEKFTFLYCLQFVLLIILNTNSFDLSRFSLDHFPIITSIPASAPGTGHWSWLPVSADSRLLIGQPLPSLACDWSPHLTSQLSWLPKIPTSTKTPTLFSVSRQGGLWTLDEEKTRRRWSTKRESKQILVLVYENLAFV